MHHVDEGSIGVLHVELQLVGLHIHMHGVLDDVSRDMQAGPPNSCELGHRYIGAGVVGEAYSTTQRPREPPEPSPRGRGTLI